VSGAQAARTRSNWNSRMRIPSESNAPQSRREQPAERREKTVGTRRPQVITLIPSNNLAQVGPCCCAAANHCNYHALRTRGSGSLPSIILATTSLR
jgi:hypothetical protein